jgi:uncharacterized membrane protein
VTSFRRLASLGFVTAGVLHFLIPDSYAGIVPDYLPAHRALVFVSGALEIAGGVGLEVPRTRAAAGKGLAALLVLVFPANLDMALHADRHSVPPALLWARLPLQGVLIWWVLRAAGLGRARVAPARTHI